MNGGPSKIQGGADRQQESCHRNPGTGHMDMMRDEWQGGGMKFAKEKPGDGRRMSPLREDSWMGEAKREGGTRGEAKRKGGTPLTLSAIFHTVLVRKS